MDLTITPEGRLLVCGPPVTIIPRLEHWFRVRKLGRDEWILPHRKVLAFLARYPTVKVDRLAWNWLQYEFSYDRVYGRVRPELKAWKGGYEARVVAEALSARIENANPKRPVEAALLIYGEYGSGKTLIFSEIARLAGPTLISIPPGVWADAYVSEARRADGQPEGDLLRLYGPKADPKYRLRWSAAMEPRNREARVAALRTEADLYAVSSYVIGKMIHEVLDVPLAAIIVEEAFQMANPNSELARACRAFRDHVPLRFSGSGNPSPTDAVQFHEQVEFCEPGLLPPRKEYIAQFKTRGTNTFASAEAKQDALRLVKGRVRMIGRDEYWPDRPPARDIIVPVELGEIQQAAYNAMRDDLRLHIGEDGRQLVARTTMEKVMKLRELTSGFVYDKRRQPVPVGEQAKLRMLGRMIRSRRFVGHTQAVLWCHWHFEYEQVARLLHDSGRSYGHYLGNDRESYRARDRFKSRRCQYLISNCQTAGHGLRLHNASRGVYMSIDYQADPLDQSKGRIWRPPQQFPCFFFFLLARGTIDYELWDSQTTAMDWQTLVRRALASPTDRTNRHDDRRQPQSAPAAHHHPRTGPARQTG